MVERLILPSLEHHYDLIGIFFSKKLFSIESFFTSIRIFDVDDFINVIHPKSGTIFKVILTLIFDRLRSNYA